MESWLWTLFSVTNRGDPDGDVATYGEAAVPPGAVGAHPVPVPVPPTHLERRLRLV